MGDKVYYKRVDSPEWRGPGVVIGQDGAVVFVRHGGTCVRVHYLRLRKVSTVDQHPRNDIAENNNNIEQGKVLTQTAGHSMDIDDYTENDTHVVQRREIIE